MKKAVAKECTGNAYFNALDLACYIADKHVTKYGRPISNIKLQKSLYFLFAYWGGFVNKSKVANKTVEQELNYKPYLFDNRIEAWTYGPVVVDVFKEFAGYCNPQRIAQSQAIIGNEIHVKEFIDDLLDDLLPLSDFRLIDLSHKDNCWINNYDELEEYHSTEIPKDIIINEYTAKRAV